MDDKYVRNLFLYLLSLLNNMTFKQNFIDWIEISFTSALIIFVGLVVAKLDRYYKLSWEETFLPLYINDLFAAFFCYNCFVRQLAIRPKKILFVKLIWSWFLVICSVMIKNGILQRIYEPIECSMLVFYSLLLMVLLISKLYLDPLIEFYAKKLFQSS